MGTELKKIGSHHFFTSINFEVLCVSSTFIFQSFQNLTFDFRWSYQFRIQVNLTGISSDFPPTHKLKLSNWFWQNKAKSSKISVKITIKFNLIHFIEIVKRRNFYNFDVNEFILRQGWPTQIGILENWPKILTFWAA
jgi:hypothetical protein